MGAYQDTDNGSSSGSAYVFVRNGTTWTEEVKLLAYDGLPFSRFGGAVSISDDRAVVAARPHDGLDIGPNSGAVYPFVRSGGVWTGGIALLPSDASSYLEFGFAVSSSGDTVLATTIRDGEVAIDSGAAYVFELLPPPGAIDCLCAAGPCGNSDDDAGCANSTGTGVLLTASGSSVPDELELFASNAPVGQFGTFLHSGTAEQLPFGDGFRCVGGRLTQLTAMPRKVMPNGTLGFGPCFGDPPISSVTGVVPGSGTTERYQLWYRDLGGPCASSFNLSNAYEIVW